MMRDRRGGDLLLDATNEVREVDIEVAGRGDCANANHEIDESTNLRIDEMT
jgi:hypothetical protein